MSRHEKLATDVWRMIRGLMGADLQTPATELAELDTAAIRLIEMACDSAVGPLDSRRFTVGSHPPDSDAFHVQVTGQEVMDAALASFREGQQDGSRNAMQTLVEREAEMAADIAKLTGEIRYLEQKVAEQSAELAELHRHLDELEM